MQYLKRFFDSMISDISAYEKIVLDASSMTLDTYLSLYEENSIEVIGNLCIVRISIKITNATALVGLNIANYIPDRYRPKSGISFTTDTGLGDGKVQGVTLYNNGRLILYPVNLNTATYAIGTAVYFK